MGVPAYWRALWFLVFLTVLTLATVLYSLSWSRGNALDYFGIGKNTGTGRWEWSKHNDIEHGEDHAAAAMGESKTIRPDNIHPIDFLISAANTKKSKIAPNGESHTLAEAAAKYRTVRGRHPPPGFDAWYAYAVESGAVITESFWNQIYHDLAPFWSFDPSLLRKQAHTLRPRMSIRHGKLQARAQDHEAQSKLAMWENMLTILANHPHVKLPDLDISCNVNDEPAMLVPWETVDTAISFARKIMLDPVDVIAEFSGLGDVQDLSAGFKFDPEWLGPRLTHPASHLGPRPLWSLVRPACSPDSPARLGQVFSDIWDAEGETSEEHAPTSLLSFEMLKGRVGGYASSWSKTMDACQSPHLQGLHSAFVAPKQMGITTHLFPLFGDSKFAMSGEILLPGALEWNISRTSGQSGDMPWEKKQNKLFWRGQATQGRAPEKYWRGFHRERFVSMLNATQVKAAEASVRTESTAVVDFAENFKILPANDYHVKCQTERRLSECIEMWADASFADNHCVGEYDAETCSSLGQYFSAQDSSTLKKEDNYKYAIAIDGDGGDDAGDFVRHLRSGRATLRSSVYRKWYDSRLVPWVHYVPVDNTFLDVYGALEYFLGSNDGAERKQTHRAIRRVLEREQFLTKDATSLPSTGILDPIDFQTGNEPYNPLLTHPPLAPNLNAHDAAARKIAVAGKEWADKVLRREDMLIYVYRLLLEYARLVDDRRERLGWVGDLIQE